MLMFEVHSAEIISLYNVAVDITATLHKEGLKQFEVGRSFTTT